jgi:YHS domain-containing protein/ketosteroid isomerase-like protein
MSTATDVVTEFIAAWTMGDIDSALALVSDDFAMQTAMEVTTGKEPVRAALQHFAPMARGARTLQQFAADERVCTVFELDVALGDDTTTLLIGEIDTVDSSRVAHSLLLFDSTSFRNSGPAVPSGEVSVDPVCGMTVDGATAAAIRQLDGREYRFCSPVCAETFDRHPERYRRGASA